ncbi:MAG: rhodanese-like domain-containing protein [Melioribacteraceae bacterium]|nr:rhodanese-like domain-containing protein [Melioribacteraceae bacterium]
MSFKKLLIIIVSSAALSFLYNSLSSGGLPLSRPEIKIEFEENISKGSDNNSNVIKAIALEEAVRIFNNEHAVFIDARDQWDYAEGHIAGAINIPEFSFDYKSPEVISLNKDATYIVYCDGDDCDVSKRLTMQLQRMGFKEVYVYFGGYNEWQDNGYPVESEETNE